MEEKYAVSKVIPEGEFNCIWTDAGLVSYKLCDRNYECDACPFDQAMRQKSAPASEAASAGKIRSAALEGNAKSQPKQDTLFEMVRNIFGGPLSRKPAEDRLYSRGHVWMKEVSADVFRLGIDHYAAALIEGVRSVVFPQTGSSSVNGSPCAWVICEDGTLAVQSPVNGIIRSVNPRLMESSALVHLDPYDSGWLNEIRSEEGVPKDSLNSSAIESLSNEQLRRLKQEMLEEFDNRLPAPGVTLLDGGVRPKNLRDVLGPVKYISVLKRLLSDRV